MVGVRSCLVYRSLSAGECAWNVWTCRWCLRSFTLLYTHFCSISCQPLAPNTHTHTLSPQCRYTGDTKSIVFYYEFHSSTKLRMFVKQEWERSHHITPPTALKHFIVHLNNKIQVAVVFGKNSFFKNSVYKEAPILGGSYLFNILNYVLLSCWWDR